MSGKESSGKFNTGSSGRECSSCSGSSGSFWTVTGWPNISIISICHNYLSVVCTNLR